MKNIDKNNLNDIINISKKILKLIYFILIVVGAYLLLRIIKELGILKFLITLLKILLPLFLGIIVAWLLNPFVRWLEKKGIRRSIGTTLSYILLIGCIFLIFEALIPLLYNQTIDLVNNFPKIFDDIKEWVTNIFIKIKNNPIDIKTIEHTMNSRLDSISKELSTSLPTLLIDFLTNAISSIGTFLIGLVIGFFLLISSDNISSSLLELLPKKNLKTSKRLFSMINKSLRNYVNGAMFDALIVFVISTIAFAIIGLKSPILFGLFCGLMNVIPYAGPYIGGAPAVIVGFSQSNGIGVAILIAIIIIQTIEGNVLQTLIISKTTKLHPVTIITGLIIFGYFFGIIGMLLSTPIIGVVKVIIKYFDEKYNILDFKQEDK